MITPEIREIQVFLALNRSGSFSAAAKELGITQPAVSSHISKLEQLIGFPLFHRHPEGTTITEQGESILPHIIRVEREYTDLLRRAEYWKRSHTQEVKIWTDGSIAGQHLRRDRNPRGDSSGNELWRDLEPSADWISALGNFEVDIVIAGSFLKSADVPGIQTFPIAVEPGLTVAWNPDYYAFDRAGFSFPDALSSSVMLPSESLATGFRNFLFNWCETTYGIRLTDFMEFRTEHEALDACRLGLGVMIFPGTVQKRMPLSDSGLTQQSAFSFLLPKAFTFGVRCRTNEQNPKILSTAKELVKLLSQ